MPYLLNSGSGPLAGWPLALAHRGGEPGPENTELALRRAVELGFRYIEIDLRTTADGVLVLFHDAVLDRATGSTGTISSMTWDELAQVTVRGSDGTECSLLRFEDALQLFPDTHFNVDLKEDAAVEPFCAAVERFGAHDRVLAASFDHARRRRTRRLMGPRTASSADRRLAWLLVLLGPFGRAARLFRGVREIDCVQVPARHRRLRVVRPAFVRRCHRAGLQVHVWTVNDPEEMTRLLDMGVDGLVTDNVEALADVMRTRGHWPQSAAGAPSP